MIIANEINITNAKLFKIDKKDDERNDEMVKYNSFMNFMANIIVKYGLNNDIGKND